MVKFSGNVREIDGTDDDELRTSLKGGWNKELPAIKDENGVVIVGHRRLKIAEEEKIDPVIKVVTFGDGDQAEAERFRLANVSNIGGAPMTATDRKRQAERLYQSGLTQEAIAHMLGVSRQTITNDLANLPMAGKLNHPKTETNPKGAGRPKGPAKTGSKRKRSPKAIERENTVAVLADAGMSTTEIAEKTGIHPRNVDQALEHVQIKREAEAQINAADLSLTAQQKNEIWRRQEMQRLGASFERRVHEEVMRRLDEMQLPLWRERVEQAKTLFERRKGAMPKDTFNTIRRALHPDSRNSISDEKLARAFDAFMALEKYLLDEKDSPTDCGTVPTSVAEWDRMRAQATKARKRGKDVKNPLRRRA